MQMRPGRVPGAKVAVPTRRTACAGARSKADSWESVLGPRCPGRAEGWAGGRPGGLSYPADPARNQAVWLLEPGRWEPRARGLLGQVLLTTSPGYVCRSETDPPRPALRLPAVAVSPQGPPEFSIQACDHTRRVPAPPPRRAYIGMHFVTRRRGRVQRGDDVPSLWLPKLLTSHSGRDGSEGAGVGGGVSRASKPRTASDNYEQCWWPL